ncbi:MAG: hypothetical protein HFJ24_02455 [Clostridia bacterium]|jgi:hypothetical protein|nr:hypothetical protein [Clostridia bacterium]MCI9106337.1 hypothetical protein [Lachnospiraceae bacterium]MCI9274903.1 hypothetical protein [Clostridia bacterium]
MAKSIVKEIIIILLLLLAVILALGVLFYDYIPNNKTVPSVPTYRTSDSVAKEVNEKITESETVLVTYQVTTDDLKALQKTNTYVPGKANPFSTYVEPVQNTEDENNITNNSSTNTNTTKNNSSTGNTFYPNTGTK